MNPIGNDRASYLLRSRAAAAPDRTPVQTPALSQQEVAAALAKADPDGYVCWAITPQQGARGG
jgi:hypothetical protein